MGRGDGGALGNITSPEVERWFESAKDQVTSEDAATGRRFNLLRVLRIDRKEASHSRLIAALLDEQGSHDQKLLFLEGFLNQFGRHMQPLPPVPLSTPGSWRVVTEEVHRHPRCRDRDLRFDIVLRCNNPLAVMVIENKVDGGERPGQCADYADYLARFERGAKALLYLTPGGSRAESMAGRDDEYARISYEDIAVWIESVLSGCPPPVREALVQYVRVAREIHRGAGGWAVSTDDPLVDFLSSGPNLRFALRIASSIDLVRERLVERFFGQVEQAARAELGDRASAWSERKPRLERSMPRPYLEWKVNEEDQLFASAQLNGPRKEILYGVAWDDQRPEGSLVPRAARAVHSALQRAMAKGARASSWWLRSGVHQRGIDEACLSASEEDGLARTVGKELGRVMLAVESELVEANRKLERERGRKG